MTYHNELIAMTPFSFHRSRLMKYFILTLKKMIRYLLKPLSFVPALCMMYLIFSFSAQPGAQSSQLSLSFGTRFITLLDKLFSLDLSADQITYYTALFHAYIRKFAHVTEYFLLAVSIALPPYVYRVRGFWLVLCAGFFCVAFACLDEYHQYFIPGRNCSPKDVLIDCIGIFPGIYLTRILGFLGRKTIFAPLALRPARSDKNSG